MQGAFFEQPAEFLLRDLVVRACAAPGVSAQLVGYREPFQPHDADELLAVPPDLTLLKFEGHEGVSLRSGCVSLKRPVFARASLHRLDLDFPDDGRGLVGGEAEGNGVFNLAEAHRDAALFDVLVHDLVVVDPRLQAPGRDLHADAEPLVLEIGRAHV